MKTLKKDELKCSNCGMVHHITESVCENCGTSLRGIKKPSFSDKHEDNKIMERR